MPGTFNRSLNILDPHFHDEIALCGKALSSKIRLMMLSSIYKESKTISQLSREFELSVSSVTFHLDILQKAGLVEVSYLPSRKGKIQICQNKIDELSLVMSLPRSEQQPNRTVIDMPVGNYTDAEFLGISGFCTNEGRHLFDDCDFFTPKRNEAQLLWCSSGFAEYTFSNPRRNLPIRSITITLEICSETLGYEMDWKSDIAFSLSGKELCRYTSLSDFGDRPGLLNPDWWKREICTQYGELKTISVTEKGCKLDGRTVTSTVKASDFSGMRNFVFRIENPKNAQHNGGFNIFGEGFGNFPQGIRMEINYDNE